MSKSERESLPRKNGVFEGIQERVSLDALQLRLCRSALSEIDADYALISLAPVAATIGEIGFFVDAVLTEQLQEDILVCVSEHKLFHGVPATFVNNQAVDWSRTLFAVPNARMESFIAALSGAAWAHTKTNGAKLFARPVFYQIHGIDDPEKPGHTFDCYVIGWASNHGTAVISHNEDCSVLRLNWTGPLPDVQSEATIFLSTVSQ